MVNTPIPAGLHNYVDGAVGCWWAGDDPAYQHYHDHEWGKPVGDDTRLFEKVCLEGFQSGLSWLTILRKRAAFRAAFRDFSPSIVAGFGAADVERLLDDAGIVRHRGKIEAAINNAQCLESIVADHGSFAAFVWQFEPTEESRPRTLDYATLGSIALTPESTALSKGLKGYGFRFVGPTTAYAFMQSMGLVNDHLDGCGQRLACEVARADFVRPSGPPPHN